MILSFHPALWISILVLWLSRGTTGRGDMHVTWEMWAAWCAGGMWRRQLSFRKVVVALPAWHLCYSWNSSSFFFYVGAPRVNSAVTTIGVDFFVKLSCLHVFVKFSASLPKSSCSILWLVFTNYLGTKITPRLVLTTGWHFGWVFACYPSSFVRCVSPAHWTPSTLTPAQLQNLCIHGDALR